MQALATLSSSIYSSLLPPITAAATQQRHAFPFFDYVQPPQPMLRPSPFAYDFSLFDPIVSSPTTRKTESVAHSVWNMVEKQQDKAREALEQFLLDEDSVNDSALRHAFSPLTRGEKMDILNEVFEDHEIDEEDELSLQLHHYLLSN